MGLVSPLGSSREQVLAALTSQLAQYGYLVERVRLADLLDEAQAREETLLPERGEPSYFKARMDAGDRLREQSGDDSALAALAIARVAKLREDREVGGSPTVYVFDSLKHPREACLLRSVYASGFWLVSLVQDPRDREQNLVEELSRQEGKADGVPQARAVELITRDEADPDSSHGQQVRDVFSSADYFLAIRSGQDWKAEVSRFLQGIFGAPFITPRVDEEAMRLAQAASLRSAAIGRQVGAVIIPKSGAPALTGTNEVPRPGGGQYWEGDSPDHRDFQGGIDPNPEFTQRVLREVFERLATGRYFSDDRNQLGGAAVLAEATAPGSDGKSLLSGTRANALIEFTRCLHAEQAAIVSAARVGVAIGGATLYTTTFPCHECTKFIVGLGIVEVQYVAPYPKSLANKLYRELIDDRPPLERSQSAGTNRRIPFRGFVGFGSRRYDEVFAARERRSRSGLAEHVPATACPIGDEWNEWGYKANRTRLYSRSLMPSIRSGRSQGSRQQPTSPNHRQLRQQVSVHSHSLRTSRWEDGCDGEGS